MAGFVERRNGRYRARFRPRGGKEVSETFDRKVDASQWLDAQRATQLRGEWVDPRAGRISFRTWAAQWQAGQVHHRESTADLADTHLRVHILPAFGDRPVASITKPDVQAWVASLTAKGLAPLTVHTSYKRLAQVILAAVEERIISVSPCRKVNLPEVVEEVTIPTLGQLEVVTARLPAHYRRVVPVVAGSGLRLGEVFGLTVDRVDWLGRTVTVDRQLQPRRQPPASAVHVARNLYLVEPKRRRSRRTIPVGQHTLDMLAAQVAAHPPGPDGILFRSGRGDPLIERVWGHAWERATRKRDKRRPERADPAERAAARDPALCPYWTLHDVRHFYASLLIAQGLSVTVVAARLGHTPAVTLRTYAHLWPDDDDRTRQAVDAVLLADDAAASPRPSRTERA